MNKTLIKLSILALAAATAACSSTATNNNQTANTNAVVVNTNVNGAAPTSAPSAPGKSDVPKAAGKTQTSEPDVFGYFFIKGKAPEGFTDISEINLGGSGEYGAKAKPPFYGLIRLKNKTDFALLKPTIDGKNISLKTKEVGGVSYEFKGTLLRTDYSGDVGSNEVVMKGTLNKFSNGGAPVAGSDVEFTWSNGG